MKPIYLLIALLAFPALACTSSAAQLTHPTDQPAQLAPTETAIPATCTITAFETLNLRAGPGTAEAVKAVLSKGDQLTILPDPPQGAWIHVRAGDLTGWINSKYCKGK